MSSHRACMSSDATYYWSLVELLRLFISSLKFDSTSEPDFLIAGCPTNSYTINYEKSCSASQASLSVAQASRSFGRNSLFYSASNGHTTTSNPVFPSNDTCVQGPSLLIGTAASPLTPGPLIETYNFTQGYQVPGMGA